jgi:hypothetical protein
MRTGGEDAVLILAFSSARTILENRLGEGIFLFVKFLG